MTAVSVVAPTGEQPLGTSAGLPAFFDGATIRLYGGDVLVVLVGAWVLASAYESQLLVIAFRSRFHRTIVLVARDGRGVPTYYGPAAIAAALRALPFEALSWRRYLYRRPAPPRLPIPIDEPADYTDSNPSWRFASSPPAPRIEVVTTPGRR